MLKYTKLESALMIMREIIIDARAKLNFRTTTAGIFVPNGRHDITFPVSRDMEENIFWKEHIFAALTGKTCASDGRRTRLLEDLIS